MTLRERDYCLDRCSSCNFTINDDMNDGRRKMEPAIRDAMRAYCEACAKEVLGIEVNVGKPLMTSFDCGGGRRVIRETKTH